MGSSGQKGHAGEVRLILHYANAYKPVTSHLPQYSVTPASQVPFYSASPVSSYPPTSVPAPPPSLAYPPNPAVYPPPPSPSPSYPPNPALYPPPPSYSSSISPTLISSTTYTSSNLSTRAISFSVSPTIQRATLLSSRFISAVSLSSTAILRQQALLHTRCNGHRPLSASI